MKKILLDCDPGMDDSVAIIMAAKAPALSLLAVTTVNGNYPADVTAANARKIIELLGRTDIPVARGMATPLTRKPPPDPFSHGEDGQAEAFLPPPSFPRAEKHAVQMIIDTVRAHPGEVTVLMTGPMSNLAMAFLLDPELPGLIGEVVAISGMFGLNEYAFANATGDTPQSEWNVYVDPEAAKIVYESGVRLTAIGLDVATHFEVDFAPEDLAALAASEKPEAKFLHTAIRFVNGRGFDAYCAIIDCMAVGYAIDPTLLETFAGRVGIESKDGLTLGMTVLDRRHHFVWQHLPRVNIACKADYARFLRLLIKLVLQ